MTSKTLTARRSAIDLADKKTLGRVAVEVKDIVAASFHKNAWPMRHMTTREVNDRVQILYAAYKYHRDELGQSIARSIDSMEQYLVAYLDKNSAALRSRSAQTWVAA